MPRAISPHKIDRYASRTAKTPFTSLLRRFRWPYLLVALLLVIYLFWPKQNFSQDLFLHSKSIDWSRYAYSQYATTSAHLCNSVMLFEALDRFGSKPARILFYPSTWDTEIASSKDRDSQLLVMARDKYKVTLIPVEMAVDGTYNASYAKFLPWGETQYNRILQLDSDATMLKNLDEVFLLPKAPVAMLRAYWKLPETRMLTSMFVLLEPSAVEYERLMAVGRGKEHYDMEILNRFYGDSALILPHRNYGLITGEFRSAEHGNYLGNDYEGWDPDMVMAEASLVHFSDWPLPKPWVMWPHNLIGDIVPRCSHENDGQEDCRNKKVWLGLYDDFRKRRKRICAYLSELAPEWHPPDRGENETSSSLIP